MYENLRRQSKQIMDIRTGYYLLLKDVENPEFSSGESWWGMLSSYVYSSEGIPPCEKLALKGELFEARKLEDQPKDTNKIALRGIKQIYLHLECDRKDLKWINYEEAQLLLAVTSYSERCRIVEEGYLNCSLEEGAEVTVRINYIQKDVAGLVRYRGPVSPYDGTMFGIQILDQRYQRQGNCDGTIQCKRYFHCPPGSGLFVALDKLCHGNTLRLLPEKQTSKSEKEETYLHEVAKELAVKEKDTNKNKKLSVESTERNSYNMGKLSKANQDNNISDFCDDSHKNLSNDDNAEISSDEKSNEEVEKIKTYADDTELKSVVDDLEQQLMKLKMEIQEKEEKWIQERMEWEMKLEGETVTQKEKIERLENMLELEKCARVKAEEEFQEERKNKKQQRKSFNREWDEFERRLLEERTLRTNVEQQLVHAQADLEQEINRKAALQGELEQSQRSAIQRAQEFERHKQYFEYRIRELESVQREDNPTNPAKNDDGSNEHCDWIIDRDEIHVTNKTIGRGAWGQVTEGSFRGCPVAVKKIHDLILSPHNRRLFEREMSIASRCRHPCLLQFIGATNDNGSPLFITELLDTNLRAVLETRALTDLEVFSIALDVARALNYLHLNKPFPIIHRDVSSANVLLWKRNDQWRAKVSDYGAANFMRQCRTVNPGAVIYSAPEAFSMHQTPKIDVYSFGLLLCEMAIGELPVPNQTTEQLALVKSFVIKEFVVKCTEQNHENRPTMEETIHDLTPHVISP